jgi:2-polyprenyl-3-methyl-5-hydroxy-6-metoxy-1,4-benzoquinol methylase
MKVRDSVKEDAFAVFFCVLKTERGGFVIEKSIENYWDNRADGYSEHVKKEMADKKKQAWGYLITEHTQGKKLNVLDVGTGPGFFAILLAEMGHKVTAVDASEAMLCQARKNAACAGVNIQFVQGDAQQIDQASESFDLIVSRNLTWTLPDPKGAYREWRRLLKQDGKMLVFDANWYLRLSKSEFQEQYEHCFKQATDQGFSERVSEQQYKRCEEIARTLPLTYENRPGWDIVALEGCGFSNVLVQENLNELVYDELEKIMYQPTPMFSICACK